MEYVEGEAGIALPTLADEMVDEIAPEGDLAGTAAIARELYRGATAAEPAASADLAEIARLTGGDLVGYEYRLRAEESLARKVAGDVEVLGLTPGQAAEGIFDALRYSVALPHRAYAIGVQRARAELAERGYREVRAKNFWKPGDAYDGLNAVYATPEGYRFELQFHTPESWHLKQNVNHPIYERARVADDPAERLALEQDMARNAEALIPPNNFAAVLDEVLAKPPPPVAEIALESDVAAIDARVEWITPEEAMRKSIQEFGGETERYMPARPPGYIGSPPSVGTYLQEQHDAVIAIGRRIDREVFAAVDEEKLGDAIAAARAKRDAVRVAADAEGKQLQEAYEAVLARFRDVDYEVRVRSSPGPERVRVQNATPEWVAASEAYFRASEEFQGAMKRLADRLMRSEKGLGKAVRARDEAYRAETLRALRRVTDIGPDPDRAAALRLLGGDVKANAALRRAEEFYPRGWLSSARPILPRYVTDGRGYHKSRGDVTEMVVAPSGRDKGFATVVHEVAHEIEATDPVVAELQRAFYQRRTRGGSWAGRQEDLERIDGYGETEQGRRDLWADPYSGKEYRPDGPHFELLSMGMESIWTGAVEIDVEHRQFVLGLMAAARRGKAFGTVTARVPVGGGVSVGSSRAAMAGARAEAAAEGTTTGARGFRVATVDERRALVIPPAWTDVRVAENPAASLAAVGRDVKGRLQYRYSAEHVERASAAKFERLRRFDAEIEKIVPRIERDAAAGVEEAAVLDLIRRTGFRVGSEADTGAAERAFGASTLRPEHVRVEGDRVVFDFVGKKGVRVYKVVQDPDLARRVEARLSRVAALPTEGGTRAIQSYTAKGGEEAARYRASTEDVLELEAWLRGGRVADPIWRGAGFSTAEWEAGEFERWTTPGSRIPLDRRMSFTADRGRVGAYGGGEVKLIVHVDGGITGRRVDRWSIYPEEQEVLTPAGIQLEVVSAEARGRTGIWDVHVREVSPPAPPVRLFDTSDARVRDYLARIDGPFKTKDFRTWYGTGVALRAVAAMPVPATAAELTAARRAVGEAVAAQLGNTPAVALKYYVDPRVFQSWEAVLASS